MANISTKFGIGASGGIHFKEPWQLIPRTSAAADYGIFDKAAASTVSTTVAFFTELANRGAIDSTNWTLNTYKTLVNVSSGKGLVSHVIGPTSGGADTTTFEITIDGVLVELPILTASGERAAMGVGFITSDTFTTASIALYSMGDLNAAKTIIGDMPGVRYTLPWDFMTAMGTPMLRFNTSLLIRAKHSASITNSTATAYSGAQYRLGLA